MKNVSICMLSLKKYHWPHLQLTYCEGTIFMTTQCASSFCVGYYVFAFLINIDTVNTLIYMWKELVVFIKWLCSDKLCISEAWAFFFVASDSFFVINGFFVVVCGQVKDHGATVINKGASIWGWPLSFSESSDAVSIVFDFKQRNSWALTVTQSVEIFCVPTICWCPVTKDSLEFLATHYLFHVFLFILVISA